MKWGLALGISVALFIIPCSASAKELKSEILELQNRWAMIKYHIPEEQRELQFANLLKQAKRVRNAHTGAAKAILWEAIILYTYAGERGGFAALGMIYQSRDLLLESLEINPAIQSGFAYTALGSLYYKMPGSPLSFGSNSQARRYLQKGIALNPSGLDSNYFMGDFLLRNQHYIKAAGYLRKAIEAPPRPNRSIADTGRKIDAGKLLEKAERHPAKS